MKRVPKTVGLLLTLNQKNLNPHANCTKTEYKGNAEGGRSINSQKIITTGNSLP